MPAIIGHSLITFCFHPYREDLRQLITKRAGLDTFMDKLSSLSKSPFYSLAAQRPQIKFRKPDDLVYDYEFCNLFKFLEHVVANAVKPDKDATEAVMNTEQSRLLDQYKEVIRQQDQELQVLRKRTQELTEEVSRLRNDNEQLSSSVQQLSDQNALLKAQQSVVGAVHPSWTSHNASLAYAEEGYSPQMLHDLQRTNDQLNYQIQEMSSEISRLRLSPPVIQEPFVSLNPTSTQHDQELGNLRSENDFLRQEVSRLSQQQMQHQQSSFYTEPNASYSSNAGLSGHPSPSAPLFVPASNSNNPELESLKKEQEDLLLLLTDQDSKLREYKDRLRQVGHPVDDDEAAPEAYDLNGV